MAPKFEAPLRELIESPSRLQQHIPEEDLPATFETIMSYLIKIKFAYEGYTVFCRYSF